MAPSIRWSTDTSKRPAVKEAAAEECSAQCKDQAGPGKAAEAAASESFDACYAKCVAQETQDIAAERKDVRAPPPFPQPNTRLRRVKAAGTTG